MAPDFPLLTLDLSPPKPSFPNFNFLTQFLVSDIINGNYSGDKVNDYVRRLEDELNKVQAFQRELPLTFLLLSDVIRKLKEVRKEKNEEKELDKGVRVKLGFTEFEKKNWMSSAQLWSPRSDESEYEPRRRGAILSFNEAIDDDDDPGLSLVPLGLEPTVVDGPGSGKGGTGGSFSGSVLYTKVDKMGKPGNKLPYQTARKRRRCWSPELHRRFVEALDKLGGSQVATPKQIRDLMQVDGLTNDEVKSHLQKYRLHVRKLPAATTTTTTRLSSDLDDRDELELGNLTIDLQHSSSPKGPFHLGRPKKCNSSSVDEDEEEKSDGHSWKTDNHM